jgi:hypothetical protein
MLELAEEEKNMVALEEESKVSSESHRFAMKDYAMVILSLENWKIMP